MKFVRALYWLLVAAGLGLAFLSSLTGVAVGCLVAALLCTFAWPRHEVQGLQNVMIVFASLCLFAALLSGFQPSWLPWTGVGVFGYIALTAKL